MLNSIDKILAAVVSQPQFEPLRQWQQLLECWGSVVGEKAAQHTRPHAISHEVLYVATSSSVWAQELKLKRRSILRQLNRYISPPFADIRFSTQHWHHETAKGDSQTEKDSGVGQQHPSYIGSELSPPLRSQASVKDPQVAFQQWAETVQARSRSLPLCPQCQCPTPPGELQRWQVCGLCAAKQWQSWDTASEEE